MDKYHQRGGSLGPPYTMPKADTGRVRQRLSEKTIGISLLYAECGIIAKQEARLPRLKSDHMTGVSQGLFVNRPRKEHWDRVYSTKGPREFSWYEPVPSRSLALIRATGALPRAPILDIGGGASTLVDHLLDEGYTDVSVLDIATVALKQARIRLAGRADSVSWIEADVLEFQPARRFTVWHDRAVLHFLMEVSSRSLYLDTMRAALDPGGHVIVATFGPDGPMSCSGLAVQRYSAQSLSTLLGPSFELRSHSIELHRTPTGVEQQFLYGWWEAKT
jgi:2-polyprenyl-3-methyl-5-hydroxy-6-metoxy-1,4-benzoquinol methylase